MLLTTKVLIKFIQALKFIQVPLFMRQSYNHMRQSYNQMGNQQ